MGEIMAQLPIDTRLKIEQQLEDGLIEQEVRPYLGISWIGEPCLRKMWYTFRWCAFQKINPRKQRLFSRGHREELIIQSDLRKIGVICHVDPSNQPEYATGHGHIKGHPDDFLDNIPDAPKTRHLGEYKTHNDKSFQKLKKEGLRKSKPMHYDQMVCLMNGFKLKRGLYIAVNKNDDERYYERIREDSERAKELIQKAMHIIKSEKPLARISDNPSWYQCSSVWCQFNEICHYGEKPLRNCRTCKFSDIHDEGKWKCAGHKIELTKSQQLIGCERHKYLVGLI